MNEPTDYERDDTHVVNRPARPTWFKVKIISVADDLYWYHDKIGDIILVREMTGPSGWGYETKDGMSVFRHDVERVAKK